MRGTYDGDDDFVGGLIITGQTTSGESGNRFFANGGDFDTRDFYVGFLTRETVVVVDGVRGAKRAPAEARSPGGAPGPPPTRSRVSVALK